MVTTPNSSASLGSLPTPAAQPVLTPARSAGVILALMLGLLLGALDNFIVATALPSIAIALNDYAGKVFVVSSYLIAQTVAIPIFGKLSDRFGRRSFYLLGLAIFLVGSVLSGLSQSLNQLIAFRAVQGVGSGAFFTVVFSIVADVFPPSQAAKLAGILSTVFGVAIVAGPLIGSYIVETTTWRWLFFVNLPVGFAAVVLTLSTLGPMRPTGRRLAFDAAGATLLAAWVGALIFALVETSNGWAWTDPRTVGLLAFSLGLLPVFLWQETRTPDPLVPLHYFRNKLIAAASGVNFLRGAILTVVVVFVPILVQFGLGGSPDAGRNVLYAFMIPMVVGAAIGGGAVSQSGYRLPVVFGLILATIGMFLLTVVPTVPPIYRFEATVLPVGVLGALVPLGMGVGLTFAPTQLAVQYSVAKGDVGTGNSLVWFLGNLGGSIVLSLLGTYQLNVQNSLAPAGPAPTYGTPAYGLWAAQLGKAVAVSIRDVWWLMIPVALAALAFAVFVIGRLPSTPSDEGSGAGPSPTVGLA